MADALKHLIDAPLARRTATHLARLDRGFDAGRFVALATDGLEDLAFKDRARRFGEAFGATLPADFDRACALVEAALAPARPPAEDLPPDQRPDPDAPAPDGLQGWVLWGLGDWIARAGQAHPARALAALHAITQRFTAEFAIRPFLIHHPALTWRTLGTWVEDPSAHVRRLVSEGSRPRLPWGERLTASVRDPSPALPLLARLQDDPSGYVRRSVANHLNDIAKDHPDRVAAWVNEHLRGAGAQRRQLLRHASRSLVKQGHPATLAAWGLGRPLQGQASLRVEGSPLRLGGAVDFVVTLQAAPGPAQRLVVDLVVEHVGLRGQRSPKVFKGWNLELAGGGSVQLRKAHPVRPLSTRRHHPGWHPVSLQVNGAVVAEAGYELLPG